MLKDFYSENILKYVILAFEYNDTELKDAALGYISKMPSADVIELFASDEWIQFSEKHESLAEEIYEKFEENMPVDDD
jgi:hypothetical protein